MHPVEVMLVPVGWVLRGRRPGEGGSIANAPELATDRRIALTSPAFADGEEIPAKHCGQFIGDDVSPALHWDALPAGTAELLLIFEDLDSPGSTPGIHTVAVFAPEPKPGKTYLPEGALIPANPGVRFLRDRRGRAKYLGPRPLPGHGPHRYRLHLYALDTRLDLAGVGGVEGLPGAVAGHVLAAGTLTGVRVS